MGERSPTPDASRRWTFSVPLVLYLGLFIGFAATTPAFLSVENSLHILLQSSPVAIAAIGMTFVLLIAGIDLSIGAGMFLASAIGGQLVVASVCPLPIAIAAMLAVGLVLGWCNGWIVSRLGTSAFIVTLSTMFIARGAGLWITKTRALNLPDEFRRLATDRWLGIPAPVVILFAAFVAAHFVLERTPFGRHLFAIGCDRAAARKAGLPVEAVTRRAFVICGGAAALAGLILVAQLAAVSPNLGQGAELDAIAAAVLGGTSLFGGRGTAGGAVLGAVFIQTVRNGLNLADANPFLYPIVTASIIFLAVLLDSIRQRMLESSLRRIIRRPDRAT